MRLFILLRSLMLTLFILFITSSAIKAQTTAFNYQGKLTEASAAANGTYDFEFALYDSLTGGTQIGTTQTLSNVSVSNGVFTVQFDFGSSAFPGADRYLEIRVKKPADASYTTLAPRQKITSAPYAIRSLNAMTADNLSQSGASQFVGANDVRLSDSRAPTAGSNFYIQNQNAGSQTASFSISGTGNANIFNAATQYNIGGNRVLSVAGTNNLFAGVNAGAVNTGSSNAFVGTSAGQANTTGFNNSFVGRNAGESSTMGNNNSFFGRNAGQANTMGSSNSFVGTSAGSSNTTGSNNTIIGTTANVGGDNLNFATALGAGAVVSTSNTVVLGRSADTVSVPGRLTKAAGSFKIDHPLDPQNKYLSHSFVESPDMMNVYNGNATTDKNGEATVTLPDYFQALNRDFRYQLTVIGQFAQAIVGEEISGNSFKIKTDKPNVKVSWQVTGIRQDKYAEDNRIPNAQEKPAAEKGKCLYAPLCAGTTVNAAPQKP